MNTNRLAALILGWLCAMPAQPTSAAVVKWWSNSWETRIPIVVNAADGMLSKQPVILRWSNLAGNSGSTGIRLSSLRLIADGKSIPFQIDHRDSEGNFLAAGNMSLDPQDELVFVAPAKKKTTYHLYLSRKPMPPAAFPSNVQAIALHDCQAHQRLATAGLSIDVQGDSPLDISANPPANLGKGTVVGMLWIGKAITGQSNNWAVVMNAHPFPADSVNRWQAVKLIVDGPVRKIVSTRCSNSTTNAADGTLNIQANVTRYFSMCSDVPLYDIEDVIECTATNGNWNGTYSDRLILGHRPNVNDTLWDGSTGIIRKFPLTNKSIPHNSEGNFDGLGELTASENVANCWYGWFNEKEQIGIAVFYGSGQASLVKPAQIRFRSGWATWSLENWISFTYTGLNAPATLIHRFRVIGFNSTKPENVNQEYRLWKSPRNYVTIGKIQRNG